MYPSMHQFGGHDMRFKRNRPKSILGRRGGSKATQSKVLSFEIEKNMNTKRHKKVVYNNLHTFMHENDDSWFQKLECHVTINKMYGACPRICSFCCEL